MPLKQTLLTLASTSLVLASATVASAMPLQTGVYSDERQRYNITITQLDDQICYVGNSIRGMIVASVTPLPSNTDIYEINQSVTVLQQAAQNTLLFGSVGRMSEFSRLRDWSDADLENAEPQVRECLTTDEPYFYQVEFEI
ncbi:MAG: hypothetical protein AAFX95_11185 [Cyanobacteria bacterium J06639_16]